MRYRINLKKIKEINWLEVLKQAKIWLRWRIMDTYILKKMIVSFFFSLGLLLIIIVVFDFSENVSKFMDNNYTTKEVIVGYYMNFIPYFINLFIPLFTFISVIWFTSQLTARNEIIAMLSSGINFYRLLLPYISGALILACFAFFMSNMIVPNSAQRLNEFKAKGMKKFSYAKSNLHIRNSANSYVFVQRWEIGNKKGIGFTYEELANDKITYKLTAENVYYIDSLQKWIINDYSIRKLSNLDHKVITGEQMDTVFNLLPKDFEQNVMIAEEMSYVELNQQIQAEKEKGSGLTKYFEIEKHTRLANSFGTIIMTLLGFTIASRKTQRGTGVHIFVGVALAFIFIFFQQISTVFSVSGGVSPVVGVWIPNLIFLAVCGVMVRFAQK